MTKILLTAALHLILLPIAVNSVPQARIKFKVWFPYYEGYFRRLAPRCADELEAYWGNDRSACHSNCACVIDCLIGAASESVKSNMQSATIALGLMPTLIPFLAPSIAEMAVLSTRSPFLAVVLSLGCPAVPYMQYPNPMQCLKASDSAILDNLNKWLRDSPLMQKWFFRAALYTIAFLAVANNLDLSVRVDLRTVSGWRCGQLFMPLIWSELSIVAYGLGMLAVRMRTRKAPTSNLALDDLVERLPQRRVKSTVEMFCARLLPWQSVEAEKDNSSSELVWCISLFAAAAQSFFGVLVFASLIFVSLVDSIPVFLRFAISCAVCRMIATIELVNLRVKLNGRRPMARDSGSL